MSDSLTFIWDETHGAMFPLGRLRKPAEEMFKHGEFYRMEPHEERSWTYHKMYMATVHDYWLNLPERIAEEPFAISADRLRYYALIKTGWSHCQTFPCKSNAEAMRWSAMLPLREPYSITTVDSNVLYQFWPKSQSYRRMNKEDFEKSSEDVLAYLKELVGAETNLEAAQ